MSLVDNQRAKASDYRILDEIEHVRMRTGMYAGSVEPITSVDWVFGGTNMEQREITVIPALLKIIYEIIDNSIDEHKRAPEILTEIRVTTTDDSITVEDNGRGIPVEIHPDTGKYIPETVFTNLRAGSNFNDAQDQSLIGTNGIGSTLSCILSSEFTITSMDGKKCFSQKITEGMRNISEPKITNSKKHGTCITLKPDLSFFKIDKLSAEHQAKIYKRIVDLAACVPGVSFFVNNEKINVKSFSQYVGLYSSDFVVDDAGDWKVGISSSSGFSAISFVNGVETTNGGTHVEYVTNQFISAIREHVKKKFKIDVKPADVKNQFAVYISATVNRPKFSSQTKECMVSPASSFNTKWELPPKMVKKILTESSIVQKILDWAAAKQAAADAEELRKASKSITKANPKSIDKFDDAVERVDRLSCTLFLAEGLSAKNSVISARGKNKFYGCYALKGKIMNVDGRKPTEVLANTEISDILTITGLNLGEKVARDVDGALWFKVRGTLVNMNDVIWFDDQCIKVWETTDREAFTPSIQEIVEYRKTTDEKQIFRRPANLRFGRIAILSDADLDGSHIASLAILFFQSFWPELFQMGCIYRMETPVYIVTEKRSKNEHYFFSIDEYQQWSKRAVAHTAEYFKGLGTFTTEQFEKFFVKIDELLVQFLPLDEPDRDKLTLAFNEDAVFADKRKVWLENFCYFEKED